MLLSKENLAVCFSTVKQNDNMFALTHVQLRPTEDCIYATNGHSLYKSRVLQQSDEYPDTGADGGSPGKDIMVPASILLKAEKNIPKKPNRVILENIRVTVTEKQVKLTTTDLDSVDVVKTKLDPTLGFPMVERIEESCYDHNKADSVVLSVAELEILVKVLKKAKQEVARIWVKDETSPVKVTTAEGALTGYIMPMRRDDV